MDGRTKKYIEDIRTFLKKYAGLVPEPEDENIPEYASPDAYELERVANQLEAGGYDIRNISFPFSSWGSGGYKPYNDKDGQAEHERLIKEFKDMQTLSRTTFYNHGMGR